MGSQSIAKALSFAGPVMLITLLLFPWVHRKLGAIILWRSTAVIFIVVYPLFSLLPNLSQCGPVVRWIALLSLIALRYMSLVVGITSINILVRTFQNLPSLKTHFLHLLWYKQMNDVASAEDRALINGLEQSISSFARAAGPVIGGFTWSWSLGNHLPAPFDYHAAVDLIPSYRQKLIVIR